jgi:electron transport complex protein RnfB
MRTGLRLAVGAAVAGVMGRLGIRAARRRYVWQIDPHKCSQCGRCATECVLTPSAVKCVHAYSVCGYCDLCSGYHLPNVRRTDTAAEHRLCPVDAIRRSFVEEPFFEYSIDEALCIGCAKCVKGCGAFGNGSLHLQVRHDRCVGCNECAIAKACPADAFVRVQADVPYRMKGDQSSPGGGRTATV